MAVKNLIRRGNTYFWRGRLPTGLDPKGERRHFTISLKTKDFDVAEMVARRMTFLKDEIAGGDPGFVTHDQLRDLIKAERDRFLTKVERVAIGANWGKNIDLK